MVSIETRTLILQLVMKCADINNSARPQRCMETWAAMVMTEFFNQGDQEKGLQIEVSKGFDRETTSIPTVQAGFIGFCVQPLFQALANLVPCDATQLTLALLSENLARWKERQAEVAAQKAADNA
ncbi:3'5'-cyclic nucleotide phosphodiesterase [Sphaeroforma arctica JP610]|uniref:3'5'-cyclic nucleotide phosphodiesterase n=1 Tax=Sphaeroforma arctica JP610 TaxID=667725 RepID=A0A0L0FTQ8_9EUKA|nr:3'5'-cyclic nucleotide phosphodiesterase [Sphaeroforma arctica JP610]KNC79318.1 3'5'-cyclic nucleotide phosphodiesterase [Sphaeroforma arctica JP610]|eukprot:XP_014153220.1 3'5'-cyclic nucleotide phosphodiesterase [Sphaeroforma arctica JP610]